MDEDYPLAQRRPGRFWGITIAALIGVAAGLALGAWQLSRAAQKNALHAAISERKSLPVLDGRVLAAIKNEAEMFWRPVLVRGRWVPEHTVFLDNRQLRGKAGFDVLTPLRIDGSEAAVVVQRGWIQRNFIDREKLPPLETPPGVVEVHGRIAPPPPRLYAFDARESGAIRQNLDLREFRAGTALPLLTGLSVQQAGAASEGLVRDRTEPGSGVEKHYGYAFQWFALSALIATLYAWFQFIAPRRKSAHA